MNCPDDSVLASFLDEALPEVEGRDVAGHVDHCEACQNRLDHLVPAALDTPVVEGTAVLEPADRATVAALIQRLQSETRLSEEFTASRQTTAGNSADWNLTLPTTLDQYQLIELVGEGATGRLYRAHDGQLQRTVAVKILKPELAAVPSSRSRFEREARACAALRHDHIVAVHRVEACQTGRPPYLVMEFVEGGSLMDQLTLDGGESVRALVEWTRQAALALQAAHDAGIIHRDIKPSNLLIDESTGRLKVADFGLARLTNAEESLTAEDVIAGTPAYMSPEQITRPKEVAGLSDVYSLGVVFYEILTGERPFRGTVRMVLNQVQHEEPVSPRRLNDRIPRDLETICLKAMAKEPRSRYVSAQELADDLQRWLEGRTVMARPVGTIQKAWRWSRRNPRLAVAGAIVAAVLTAGAVDWGQLRSTSLENRLRRQWAEDVARRDKLISTMADRTRTAEHSWLLSIEAVRSLTTDGADTRPAIQAIQRLSDEILSQTEPTPATVIAARELADIWIELGRHSDADPLFRLAAGHATALLKQKPDDMDLRLALTGVLIRHANLKLKAGELRESVELLSSAENAIDAPPAREIPRVVVDRAAIQHGFGDAEFQQENFEAAAERYDQALGLVVSAASSIDEATTLSLRSILTLKLASVLNRTESDRAHSICLQACELNLVATGEEDEEALTRAARSHEELAICLARQNRLPEAIEAATRHREILTQLTDTSGFNKALSQEIGTVWLQLATLHTRLEDWSAATAAAEQAIQLLRPRAVSKTGQVADQLTLAEAELLLATARISGGSDVGLDFFRSIELRIQAAQIEAAGDEPLIKARAVELLMRCRELIEASSPNQ